MGITYSGTVQLGSRLRSYQVRANDAARNSAVAMSAVGERAIKLKLSTSSHLKGTRTPSRPYINPPSLITGQLRRSVIRTRLYREGNRWVAHVAPTTVYARIQELGGITGWQHRTHLPPRPYVRPAVDQSLTETRDAAIRAFRSSMGL